MKIYFLSRLSSIEFKRKYYNNDFWLYFYVSLFWSFRSRRLTSLPLVYKQVVFHCWHSLSWCLFPYQSTVQWLQWSSFVWRSAMECYQIDLVCSHQLPPAGEKLKSCLTKPPLSSTGIPSCNNWSTMLTSRNTLAAVRSC